MAENSSSETMWAPLCETALRALSAPAGAPATTQCLASYLCAAAPFSQYAVLSLLRGGAVREVLQHLLSLRPTPETTAAAVRIAVVLADTPELARTCEALTGRSNACWTLRTRALLTYFAGPAARDVMSWASTFKHLALIDDKGEEDETTYDVLGERAELRMAVAFVLGSGNSVTSRVLPPVVSWAEQNVPGVVESPSIWREVAWARYARRCILGQAEPTLPSLPACGEMQNFDVVSGSAHKGVVGPEEYITIEGVRLRRRRPKGTAFAGNYPKAPKTLSNGELAARSVETDAGTRPDTEDAHMEDVSPVDGVADLSKHVCVQTAAVCQTTARIARGLADGRAVLLEGPPGCGKSEILSHLAGRTAPLDAPSGNDDSVVRVQMDSIIGVSGDDEFAALIGAVVPLPGGAGFRWRPGPIGAALERGAWLLLENIGGSRGSLSSSVSATVAQLVQLQAGDTFEAPGRGLPIHVAPGFAILATRTTAVVEADAEAKIVDALTSDWEPPGNWVSWRQVRMPALHEDDLAAILTSRFPNVTDCVPRVLTAISEVRKGVCSSNGRPRATARTPNMRDAVKLCRRLAALRSSFTGDAVSPESAFAETMDVLCHWEQNLAYRNALLANVSLSWSLGCDAAQSIVTCVAPSFSASETAAQIGRARLSCSEHYRDSGGAGELAKRSSPSSGKLSLNGHTLRLLERVGRCVEMGESVLLSGYSGSGKTACVQELATRVGKRLVVVNLSRNSDIGDLLGGFRPVDLASSVSALARTFEAVFCSVVSREKNNRFLQALRFASRSRKHHSRALKLMRGAINALPCASRTGSSPKESAVWENVFAELSRLERLVAPPSSSVSVRTSEQLKGGLEDAHPPAKRRKTSIDAGVTPVNDASREQRQVMEFEFGDGVLVSAMRRGDWILLDEINLAPTELLERLVGLVDDHRLSIANAEAEVVSCANGFALFAAMNPPTDVGKKPLPTALRSRFTEFFVDDCLSRTDISALALKRLFNLDAESTLGQGQEQKQLCDDVADFYVGCRSLADLGHLSDGNDKKVRYSLRSLSRMLDFAFAVSRNMASITRGYRRALYEGAHLAFITPLPRESREKVKKLAFKTLLCISGTNVGGQNLRSRQRQDLGKLCDSMKPPGGVSVLKVAGFHVECSPGVEQGLEGPTSGKQEEFVVTQTVLRTLEDVCRALVVGAPRLPVLLQGPTAAGKTSIVAYLAKLTGKQLVRINNHEHTDVAEYLGGYVASEDGTLQFQEGPVVRAARRGDWIVLDELNLAPPEVLEALNRLLDDNREIRVPETGEVVRAVDGFSIFATQNPPGLYGGRKELSLAFRGRFVEVQVDDLPDCDLKEILVSKSHLPVSFAERMVSSMRELQVRRRASQLFSGKSGFVTARDLFRWASRQSKSREELAVAGFFLLGERSRVEAERKTVRDVLIAHVGVDPQLLTDENLYSLEPPRSGEDGLWDSKTKTFFAKLRLCAETAGIALTPTMRRMLTLVGHGALHAEPVLLVGGTGCGKTTACSIVSKALDLSLATVSCHRHSEASDFVGSFRPVVRRSAAALDNNGKLFDWVDGPLVDSMRQGQGFLVDEINMADDAVTERLNSVLETGRTLLLSEKGGNSSGAEAVQAAEGFRAFATMNPGGDFGKKELSPALRNRFTEVWIPAARSTSDFAPVVFSKLDRKGAAKSDESSCETQLHAAGEAIVAFVGWTFESYQCSSKGSPGTGKGYDITLRDAAAWADFVKQVCARLPLHPMIAFAHGARLVVLDGFTVGSTSATESRIGDAMWRKVLELVPEQLRPEAELATFEAVTVQEFARDLSGALDLSFGPFSIPRNLGAQKETSSMTGRTGFAFGARSTARNCARIARAMALDRRPILLEGPPGAGKSSVVEAIAQFSSPQFSRVNLSEHTEMSDLMGGFVPTDKAGVFSFRQGPLLTAMRGGEWILLDELNLASQSVLEGLNAVLDHRCSVHVPEMGKEIVAELGFRVFAAQNAAHQGGGRRGLPQSFLNRFTRVNVEAPTNEDIEYISKVTHPTLATKVVEGIVTTLQDVGSALSTSSVPASSDFGAMNLRDALRWCDLLDGIGDGDHLSDSSSGTVAPDGPETFLDTVVLQRMPSIEARGFAVDAFANVFGLAPDVNKLPVIRVSSQAKAVRIGRVYLTRRASFEAAFRSCVPQFDISEARPLEALAHAVSSHWPAIVTAGGPGSKKSSSDAPDLVHKLGILCGQHVVEMRIGSGTDSADLLGGYTQCDFTREIRLAISCSIETANGFVRSLASDSACLVLSGNDDATSILEALETTLEAARALLYSWNKNNDNVARDMEHAHQLLTTTRDQVAALEGMFSSGDNASKRSFVACSFDEAIAFEKKARLFARGTAGAFEWRKSSLVEAAERGDWVLIRDADQCPAAVLDRLNPLLERPPMRIASASDRLQLKKHSGGLLLPEAPASEDGSPAMIFPHENFRLFMTVDGRRSSSAGKGLSKALRNRSLEVYLNGEDLSAERACAEHCREGGLPGGLSQYVASEWETLSRSARLAPAVTERFLLRLSDTSKCLFAYVPAFTAKDAVANSFHELFHVQTQCISRSGSDGGSHHRLCDFNSSLEVDFGGLSSVREISTSSSSLFAARDLSVIRRLLEVLSEYSMLRDGVGDVSAAAFPVGTDACMEDDLAVAVRAVYYLGEAFVMGSVAASDILARMSLLSSETAQHEGKLGYSDLKDFISATLHGQAPHTDEVQSRSSRLCAPLDPKFGMDETAVSLLPRLVGKGDILVRRKMGLKLRFQVTCVGPLLAAWERAIADTKDVGGKSRRLFRSKLACEAGAIDATSLGSDAALMEAHAYPLLLAIVESIGFLVEHLAASEVWEIPEEQEWRSFLQIGARICVCVGPDVDDGDPQFVRFVSLLQLLIASTPSAVNDLPALAPIKLALNEVRSSFGKHLSMMDHVAIAKQGFSSPRLESAFCAEAKLLELVGSFPLDRFGVRERKAIVQALVTLSSRGGNGQESIVSTVSEISDVVRENAIRASECDALNSEVVRELSTWDVVSEASCMSSMVWALLHWNTALRDSSLGTHEGAKKAFGGALERVYLSCVLDLPGMAPYQRMTWLADADRDSSLSGDRIRLLDVERHAAGLEGMLAYLRYISRLECGSCDSEIRTLTDRVIPLDGSYLTLSSLSQHRKSASKGHLWRSADDLSDASCAASVLMVGSTMQPTAVYHSRISYARGLLVLNVVQLLRASLPAVCSAKLLTIDPQLACDIDESMTVVDIIRETVAGLDVSSQAAVIQVGNVLCDALMLTRAVSCADSDVVLEEIVGAFGLVWSTLGAARLSTVAERFDASCGLDPAVLAAVEVEELALRSVDARAKKIAYESIGIARLSRNSSKQSGPVQAAHLSVANVEEKLAISRMGISFRPQNKASFIVLCDVICRLEATCVSEGQVAAVVDRLYAIALGRCVTDEHESVQARTTALDESLRSAGERLDLGGELGHLRDLGGSAALAIGEIRHGLAICSWSAKRKLHFSRGRLFSKRLMFQDALLFPRAAFFKAREPEELLALCLRSGLKARYLKAILELLLSHIDTHGHAALSAVFFGLEELVTLWKKELLASEAAAEVADSLYRMNMAVKTASDSAYGASSSVRNVDQEEEDFHQMFNSHASTLAMFEETASSTSVDADVPNVEGVSEEDSECSEGDAGLTGKCLAPSDAWSLYRRAVLRGVRGNSPTTSSTVRHRSHLLQELVQLYADLLDGGEQRWEKGLLVEPNSDDDSVTAFLAAAFRLHGVEGLIPSTHRMFGEADRTVYNFYSDSNSTEALRGASCLLQLSEAVSAVQSSCFKDSGDHPVLQGVAIAAERAARARSSTPLSVLVVGLETVLRKVDEWQRHFATKEMRMDREVRAVAETASRWRKLEISSWPQLLDSRRVTAEATAHKWFYYLHDVIFAKNNFTDPPGKDVLATLDTFLRSSPCGEFSLRIDMLSCFGIHLLQIAGLENTDPPSLAFFLGGLSSYYSQYLESVEASIASARRPLDGQMNEYASLAKWDKEGDLGASVKMDRSMDRHLEYHRLKAASESTRRKLHKVCREMDSALQVPVSAIVLCADKGVGYGDMDDIARARGSGKVLFSAEAISLSNCVQRMCKTNISIHQDVLRVPEELASGRFGRLPDLCTRMERLANLSLESSVCRTGVDIASRLREVVCSQVSKLRNSPKIGVQMKQKALADLLRTLKALGVSSHPNFVPALRQAPSYWLSTPSVCLGDSDAIKVIDLAFLSAAKCFGRLRDASAGSNLNPDISRNEAVQCVSLSVHMLDMAGSQRTSLRLALSAAREIAELAHDVGTARFSSQAINTLECSNVHIPGSATCVFYLRRARQRLCSILADMDIACARAAAVVASGESVERKLSMSSQTLTARDMGRKAHLRRVLRDASQVSALLSNALSCIRERIDELQPVEVVCNTPAEQYASDSQFLLTDSMIQESSAALRMFSELHEILKALEADAKKLPPTNFALKTLTPVVCFTREVLREAQVLSTPPSCHDDDQSHVLAAISRQAEDLVSATLVATQRYCESRSRGSAAREGHSAALSDDDEGDLVVPNGFTTAHSDIIDCVPVSDLVCIRAKLRGMVGLLCKVDMRKVSKVPACPFEIIARATGAFVLHFLRKVISPILCEHVAFHHAGLRLLRTLESLFVGLCNEGYCRPPEGDTAVEGDEHLQAHDGTGFGDIGDGDASLAKDVSEQVEDEEQLLGLNNGEEKNEAPKQPPDEEEEEGNTGGVEMSGDFDGEFEDAMERESDDGDGEDEGDGEVEKRIGDDHEIGSNIVDEQLWDDDEDKAAGCPHTSQMEKGEEIESGGVGPEADLVARDENERRSTKKENGDTSRSQRTEGENDEEAEDDPEVGNHDESEQSDLSGDAGSDAEDEGRNNRPKLKIDDSNRATENGEPSDGENETNGDAAGFETVEQDGEDSGNQTDSAYPPESAPENVDQGGADVDDEAEEGMSGNAIGGEDGNEDKQDGDMVGTSEGDVGDERGQSDEEDFPNQIPVGEEKDGTKDGSVCSDDAPGDAYADPLDQLPADNSGKNDQVDDGLESGHEQGEDPGDTVGAEADSQRESLHESLAENVEVSGPETVSYEHNKKSGSRGTDPVAGVSGGEMNMANSERSADAVQSAGPSKGASSTGDPSVTPSGGADSGEAKQHMNDVSNGENPSSDNARNAGIDPNPHRQVASDADLAEQWRSRLNMLKSDNATGEDGEEDTERSNGALGSLFDFMNSSPKEDDECDDGDMQNPKTFALGPATEQQHRVLPDSQNDDPSDSADVIDGEQLSKQQTDGASSPQPPSSAVHRGEEHRKSNNECTQGGENEQGGSIMEDIETDLIPGSTRSAAEEAFEALEAGLQAPVAKDSPARTGWQAQDVENEWREDADPKEEPLEVELREQTMALLKDTPPRDMGEGTARDLWQRLESLTSSSSASLCEQLRLVLEPTVASGMGGDFRTGKRMNMKRIIEFVASDFRRDRIWLRRIRPEKRTYDVLIAIDDSESMAESGAGPLALEALSLLTSALARLEVGRVAVATFGTETELVRGFDEPLPMDDVAGGRVISAFTFAQKQTDAIKLLEALYRKMCGPEYDGDGDSEQIKLAFVVTDGQLNERDDVRRKIRELQSANVLVAFLVVDVLSDDRKSIFDVKRVEYDPEMPGKMTVTPYMDKFPVEFYSVIRDVSALPVTLGDALRQWFEAVSVTG